MIRVFWLLFIMVATACAGAFVIAVLSMPSLAMSQKALIPMAAAAGVVVGGGIAYLLAKKISANIV